MTCPICSKPTQAATRPFCSKRCADVDLARWLNGSYAVPSQTPEDDEALDAALRDADKGEGPQTQH
ncbi:MAG: DNA gyrase inhibitor YacG [Roseobacter sp.]